MPADDSLKDAINSFVMSLEEEVKSSKILQKKEEEMSLEKNVPAKITQPARGSIKTNEGFEKIIEIVKNIIEMISTDNELKIDSNPEKAKISVYGKDLSIVIGKNGKNIDAVEYIVNLIAKRKKFSDKRILIDIKDYRKKNSDKIRKMALRMAEKAVKEGHKIALRPMPPYERKIVHDLLSKIKNVETRSRDDEPNRRIVIYPVENKQE